MPRKEVLELLGVSLNTFKKWASAHSIETNKSDYIDDDIAKLQDCQQKMSGGMRWDDYLRSLGKQSDQTSVGSALAQRYGKDVEKMAKPIAATMVQALDNAVANEFRNQLQSSRSTVFTQLVDSFTLELEATNPIALLEGEIVDDEL